jgi:hypothetical protein
MGANQSSRDNMKFFRIVAKAEKADIKGKRAICEIKKQGTEYVVSEWFNNITGWITGLEIKEVEYQGKKNKILVMQLTDSDGVCQIEFSLSGAAYSLINCLIGADLTKEVEISAWIKDDKYVNASVKYTSGEKCEWSIPIEEQPKPVEFTKPSGEKEKDFANVKNWWLEKFVSIKGKATKANFKGEIKQQEAPPAVSQQQSSNIQDFTGAANEPDNLLF